MLPRSTPDLFALQLLDSVAELGSLGQAAARHGVSQAAVSMRMSQLERRLGVTLLLRGPAGTRLTPAGRQIAALGRRTVSDRIDTLQKRAADLKSSFEQTQHENNEKVKARLAQAKADIVAGQRAVNEKTEQAAGHTQSQWKSMKADAAAKVQDMHDRAEASATSMTLRRQAERDAEAAEEDAADALDYATWAVDQAELAVLDAMDARSWADERSAASPPR
jgi:molybdenum-dependent DNA-binding transcriptional regulator ModE